MLATGQPVERELRDVAGSSFFLRILPYRAKGTVDGVVLTLIDVSGLKAAEDALFHERYLLNSLLASVPDAIYFKDARGRFIRANHAMAERLGLADPADAVGKTALELPDQDAALRAAPAGRGGAAHRRGAALQARDARRPPTAVDAWDLVTRLPLRDRDGRRSSASSAIFRDVTEQKRAEEKIQEAVRRRDQFLAMLSHELRNPLGAIVTATALLKATARVAAKPDRFLDILERQSQQMARLLDDLLEASRVTQNKIELRKQVVDLRAVARDAADAVRAPDGGARACSFSSSIDDRAALRRRRPGAAPADPGEPAEQRREVHAARRSRRCSRRRARTARRVIRVRDDGAGIRADMLDSVFDLFVQSSRTLDRAAGGLGVGLTLVRSLVAMHGGTVTAHSDGEGKGSEFVVRLPLASSAAGRDAAASRRGTRPLRDRARRSSIVEDNADSREMLCELLALAGFECRSGRERRGRPRADRRVRARRRDPRRRPAGDGRLRGRAAPAREPRARRASASIALTGYGQAADRATAREAGFDEHLVKPVDVDELLRLLADMRGGAPVEETRRSPKVGDSESPEVQEA